MPSNSIGPYYRGAGDIALQTVADSLREPLRKTDFAGRLGGEEISLLLPETSLEHAPIPAERVWLRISAREIILGKRALHATVSIGVATLSAVDANPNNVFLPGPIPPARGQERRPQPG